jgi:hypothetical protein
MEWVSRSFGSLPELELVDFPARKCIRGVIQTVQAHANGLLPFLLDLIFANFLRTQCDPLPHDILQAVVHL